MSSLPVILIGSGGHALVLLDALLLGGATVIGLTDADAARHGRTVLGHAVLGGDDAIDRYPPASVSLANGIGSIGSPALRKRIFEKFRGAGYGFVRVLHPAAVVAPSATLSEGAQIMAGVVLQADVRIGENSIVNTGSTVDHGCRIGAHVHLAPGVTLSGDVVVGDETHVGPGVTIIQGVRIGRGSIIGAGSVVLKDVPDGARVAGKPAEAKS